MDRIFLSPEQAKSLLLDSDNIHTFRNPNGFLIGVGWSRNKIIELIDSVPPEYIEIGGDSCKSIGHGLVVWSNGPLFIEADKSKIEKLETQLSA